jgi:hypothetical protein
VANKLDHARHALGTLVDGSLATPAKQSPVPLRKGNSPELYSLTRRRRCLLSGAAELSATPAQCPRRP